MSHPELAARLRELATGHVEWRVQHPLERNSMSFSSADCMHPEREAREWLADQKRRLPESWHASYELAEVRTFTRLERAALDAADALDPASRSIFVVNGEAGGQSE